MVNAANRFSKDVSDFQDFELGASSLVLFLVNCVCYNDFVEGAGIDALNGVAGKDTVGDECVHFGRTFLLQQLCGASDGVGCVGQVIDKDGRALGDISDQHHGSILTVVDLCGSALLVDESERHAKCISNGSRTLSTASIGTDYDSLEVVGDVKLYVLSEKMTAVEIVHWNVEEALVLGVYAC